MPYNPLRVLRSGGQKDIPVIAGVTKDEGGFPVALAYSQVRVHLTEEI